MKVFLVLSFMAIISSCAYNTALKSQAADEFDVAGETSDFIIEGQEDQGLSFENIALKEESEEAIQKEAGTEHLGRYEVRENDTLMLIAFKLYGDYRRWRELLELNSQVVGSDLDGISQIVYKKDQAKFDWKPAGDPYLIKRGDSLSRISGNVYGVLKRWPEIYSNNRKMIHDPNLIFAGFTLYYIPDRSLASE